MDRPDTVSLSNWAAELDNDTKGVVRLARGDPQRRSVLSLIITAAFHARDRWSDDDAGIDNVLCD